MAKKENGHQEVKDTEYRCDCGTFASGGGSPGDPQGVSDCIDAHEQYHLNVLGRSCEDCPAGTTCNPPLLVSPDEEECEALNAEYACLQKLINNPDCSEGTVCESELIFRLGEVSTLYT